MKAMVLDVYGDDAAFEVAEPPRPEMQPGQVPVRVAATGVKTIDTMIRGMARTCPLRAICPPGPTWILPRRWKRSARI